MPEPSAEGEPRDARGPSEEEIEALLQQYSRMGGKTEAPGAAPSGAPAPAGAPAGAAPLVFAPLNTQTTERVEHRLDLLQDVPLRLRVELGRCRMKVQDVLQLGRGSLVELDRLAGDPLDVFVNDRLVARGEVVVQNNNFSVRIVEVINPAVRPGGGATP